MQFYKRVLQLRHTKPALLDGSYAAINQDDPNVLSYLRVSKDQGMVVALNMSGARQKIKLELTANGFASAKGVLATGKSEANGNVVSLDPYGVFIGELVK